jgi:NAD(P)-dependent dehydrogenase (short-subunit alcohol dehydrogenase family)
MPYCCDVSSSSAVTDMVQASVSTLGPLNTMIANAGIAQVKPLLELTDDDTRRMMDVNFFGVYNCYTAAAKQMIAQGPAAAAASRTTYRILGAASIVAFRPFALLGHYSASKWAVRGLTQAMAMEVSAHGIRVNAYAPGIVGTAMWDLIDENMGRIKGAKKGDTIRKYSEELIALGRTSVPEDVAKLVSFLAGEDSEYVTGQTMIVDGGIQFT